MMRKTRLSKSGIFLKGPMTLKCSISLGPQIKTRSLSQLDANWLKKM